MPTNFQDADKILPEVAWDLYQGSHFKYWNGCSIHDKAKRVSSETRKLYYQELRRIFHSYNVVGRIISHYVNALVGKPFTLSLRNKDSSQFAVRSSQLDDNREPRPANRELGIDSRLETASTLLNNWLAWQSKTNIKKGCDRGSALAEAITQMLATGTGYLRLYQPRRFRNLAEPYQRVVLHCPRYGSIETKRDDDEILYWARYHFGQGKEETYELLDNGLTRITDADGSFRVVDYQGSLPIFELNGRALITKDLMQIQQAINKLLTMWDKNLEYAGFPERVILGGQPPGHWEEDKATGRKRFVPNPALMELGADKIAFIPGLPIGDVNNPTNYTRPEMFYRDPVAVDNFVKTLECYKGNAYEVAGLGHLMAQGGDRISGKSRIAGKEDYVADLGNYERIIEDTIFEIVTLVLLQLNKFYEDINLLDYLPVADLNLSITSPPEEREQNRLDYQAGLLSSSTVISSNGRDPAPELAKIESDRQRNLEMLQKEVDFTREESFEA